MYSEGKRTFKWMYFRQDTYFRIKSTGHELCSSSDMEFCIDVMGDFVIKAWEVDGDLILYVKYPMSDGE